MCPEARPIELPPPFSEPRNVFARPNLTVVGVAPNGRFLAIQRRREPVTRFEIIVNWLAESQRASAVKNEAIASMRQPCLYFRPGAICQR